MSNKFLMPVLLLLLLLSADTLLVPSLTLLSPHTVFAAGEAVRFGCSAQQGHHISDFHLYRQGVSIPLVMQRADQTQLRAELTLSDVEAFQQGSYTCRYRVKRGFSTQLLSSPFSNSINITVGTCAGVLLIYVSL